MHACFVGSLYAFVIDVIIACLSARKSSMLSAPQFVLSRLILSAARIVLRFVFLAANVAVTKSLSGFMSIAIPGMCVLSQPDVSQCCR